jgi:hypothetical protein
MYVEMLWSKSPEAAVEALGDIADPESIARLREVARSDTSEFIRNMAEEVLEECSE